ncbi:gamma glutamyl-transpeptidase [Gongronella butleri]|nr:gamma glutamyl-transpeptidase [Gongronella butleri]
MANRTEHPRSDERQPLLEGAAVQQSPKRKMARWALLGMVFMLVIGAAVGIYAWLGSRARQMPAFVGHASYGERGAVATETEQCSQVGIEILQQGGNAVDSAIASALCVGVIDAFATGIGGGGFMLVRAANGSYDYLDFREQASKDAYPEMFVDDPLAAQIGGKAIATPGEIAGFELAHARHGSLPWSDLFQPAIRLAADGFVVTRLLEERLQASADWLVAQPEFMQVYAPTGVLAQQGDVISRPALAKTLTTIAEHGARAFYEGDVAEKMVSAIQQHGGLLTMADFANYSAVARLPLQSYYHGRRVTVAGAPTGGPVTLAMLNILERFNLGKSAFQAPLSVHRVVEALKYGFAFRSELGDPAFVDGVSGRIAEVTSKAYAAQLRANLSDTRTYGPMHYGPKYDTIDSHGTMHLSVADDTGMAVALTSSVNLMFGARVLDPHTGIIFNCQMDDFSIFHTPNMFGLYPSPSNYPEPWKRPLSSITPVMVESDDALELVLGGSGGTMILSATLNVLLNSLDYDLPLYDAVASARVHHQLMPNLLIVEDDRDADLIQSLKDRGHEIFVLPREYQISAVQAIRRLSKGGFEAVSDPRKYGLAAAY